MTKTTQPWRNRRTGQYEFSTGFDRVCVCGHRLGAHIAGGHECIVHDVGNDGLGGEGIGGEPCSCVKFRASRAKKSA